MDLLDCIIIGGSYAGLSAAMALGRSNRQVLIIDSGLPCNRQTPHSHNFLTRDGSTPAEINTIARAQVLAYPTVRFCEGLAVKGTRTETGFAVETGKGKVYEAKKLLFATGISDLLPDIEGLGECWGISVVHCPYCHGYELKGKKTAILAGGEKTFHLASLVANLSPDISILTNGDATLTETQREKLAAHGIGIIETKLVSILHDQGQVRELVFADGTRIGFDAVYAVAGFKQHCAIPATLGCALTEQGYIQTEGFQKTTAAGVYAAGDNCSPMRSVASAVAQGNMAGAMINRELTEDEF